MPQVAAEERAPAPVVGRPAREFPDVQSRGNRIVRSAMALKRQREKSRDKAARRRKRHRDEDALGDAAPPRKVPKTIERLREYDDETGRPVTAEQARAVDDEFTRVLAGEVKPNVLITTAVKASVMSYDFVKAVLPVFPNSVYYERKRTTVAELTAYAIAGGFSDVLIIKEDKKNLSSLIHAHLPIGPTSVYKITSFVQAKEIRGHGRSTSHTPEVLLNNFSTELGLRIGRMLGSLFPHDPNFIGRQAATFHNQRDFIFFRFHRYVFSAGRDKARLQELGPRFTLKLQGLQKGTFKDPQKAEHEWTNSTKKDVARRRFFL
jgi:ribosome production factor 1